MKHLSEIKKKDFEDIKLIVLDVDGVLVRRGTKIKQIGNMMRLETKHIHRKQIEQIKELHKKGYFININSGRGLYMLQEIFREILPFVSLTYENGSATWIKGKMFQHVNSFNYLGNIILKLQKVKHVDIKGFEPKEFIITLHCKKRIKAIDRIMSGERKLYSIWNGESYDIGVKGLQTKAVGLDHLRTFLGLKKKNILVIGDNFNDAEMMAKGGLAVSADKSRVSGNFFVELNGGKLPADVLMDKLLKLV
jgi:hydroxymethylpyrimidine pyrophosphatase-like HAD family hydrolase